jgi:gliding motility-associated-like protein
VQVTIEGISALNIANTITPNGDGINDYWKISGIENYPNASVQIFTRYGQKVFDSKGYAQPFDGTSNGTPLPVGVYYYIINLNTNCNLLSGNLTIIR